MITANPRITALAVKHLAMTRELPADASPMTNAEFEIAVEMLNVYYLNRLADAVNTLRRL